MSQVKRVADSMIITILFEQLEARAQKRIKTDARDQKLLIKFGHAIRAERKRQKIRLDVFSKNMGVSTTMTSYLESGSRGWNLTMAKRAVELLQGEHGK